MKLPLVVLSVQPYPHPSPLVGWLVPAGSEPLVQHMLEVLSATLLPSEAMMAAVRDRVMATGG
jgi:hypothetical protein